MQHVPCRSCARHVRAGARACPFCDHVPADGFRAPNAPAPRARLGRAALFAFGAIATACGASTGLDGLDPGRRAEDGQVRELDASAPPDAAVIVAVDAGRDAGPIE